VQFQSVTTAGRPSGVSAYIIDNSTNDWFERYSTVAGAWISPLQSSLTGGKGTAGSVVFLDANGRATQDNANFFYNSSLFTLRLGPTGIADKAEIGSSDGAGLPYIRLFNANVRDGFIKLNNSDQFEFNTGLNVLGAIVTTSRLKAVGLTSYGTGQTTTGQSIGGELILRPNLSNPAFINFTENGAANWSNLGVDNGNGDLKYETAPTGEAHWETGTTRLVLKQNGRLGIGASTTVNYNLEQVGQTDAFGIARGTVAQRPTIVASTTPIRYNTDSTALEYGESVGTWRQIASRAYVRSLVSGLGTGTVTSVGLSLPSIFSVSGSPVTTSGTLSASFTGGSSSQFLRGNGAWGNTLFTSTLDTTIFYGNGSGGGTAPLIMKTDDGTGYNAYREFAEYGYQFNYIYTSGFNDECRLYLGNARGTYASPTSLLKNDRIGGLYFHAYGNSQFNKTAVIRVEVDSIYSGDRPMSKIIFGVDENNNAEVSSNWRFLIKNERNVNTIDAITGQNQGVGLTEVETILARLHVKGLGTGTHKTMLIEDNAGADILTVTDNKTIQAHGYATGAKTAAALGLTESNYFGLATNGTIIDMERKRDTTIYIVDADYDFSAALTTAQISRRYNRVVFWMTTTGAAGSDSELTLHTPDANLMQVEYLIHSVDEPAGFDNKIVFGTNNAVDSTNGLVTNYYPAAGDGIHIRAGLRSGVYKYRYSN
jgi:hypothetical protein